MDSLGIRGVRCPCCGSTDICVSDSYTVIDGSSLYKTESRLDRNGKKFDIAFRPVYNGNKTQFQCKDCGVNFEYKIRNDEVETLSENN